MTEPESEWIELVHHRRSPWNTASKRTHWAWGLIDDAPGLTWIDCGDASSRLRCSVAMIRSRREARTMRRLEVAT